MQSRVEEVKQQLEAFPPEDSSAERLELLSLLMRELRAGERWSDIGQAGPAAIELARHLDNEPLLMANLLISAFGKYMVSDYPLALEQAWEALRISQKREDRESEARAEAVLALVEWSLGNFDGVQRHGYRNIELHQQIGDEVGLAWAYYVMGSVQLELGSPDEALKTLEDANARFERLNERPGIGRTLNGIGAALAAKGRWDEALDYHQRSLQCFRELNNRSGEARALHDLGDFYKSRQQYDAAMDFYRQSLELRQGEGFRLAEVTSLTSIGSLHLEQRQVEQAMPVLHKALSIAEELRTRPRLLQLHRLLSEGYEAAGDLEKALRHHKEFQRAEREVYHEEGDVRLLNLQRGFEAEHNRKETEIYRLRNVELKEKNDELKRLVEEMQSMQARLLQSERMAGLGSLVAGISHELNSPLGVICSAVDVVGRALDRLHQAPNPDLIALLRANQGLAVDGLRRIQDLVARLKSFARLDEAEYQQTDLLEGIRAAVALLRPLMPEGVDVREQLDPLPPIYCYPAELNQVFLNLIRNAGEAIDGAGRITISTLAAANTLEIRVADTGRGIPPERLPTLFTPTFVEKDSRVRSAISLFACHNIVRKHQGEIEVDSTPGRGSTFIVRLPRSLENDHLQSQMPLSHPVM